MIYKPASGYAARVWIGTPLARVWLPLGTHDRNMARRLLAALQKAPRNPALSLAGTKGETLPEPDRRFVVKPGSDVPLTLAQAVAALDATNNPNCGIYLAPWCSDAEPPHEDEDGNEDTCGQSQADRRLPGADEDPR